MAFTPMDTGYKPEFALGAWVAGENAANQRALAQEELIKNYLANQRETSIQPLDKSIKETEAARAEMGRSSPMLDAYQRGYVGQADSQQVAGNVAKALEPFKVNAEKQALENEANKQGILFTIQDIDKKLSTGGSTDDQGLLVPFSPQQKVFMQKKRTELVDSLKSTPEFAQKKELSDDKLASALEIAQLKALHAQQIAEARKAQDKAENESQMLAWAHRTATNPNAPAELKTQAKAMIDSVAMRKLMGSAQGWATGLDVPQISGQPAAPTPVQKAQAAVGQSPAATAPQTFADSIRQDANPIASLVQKSGEKYEPNIYEYRVVDGKVQKRKKGN